MFTRRALSLVLAILWLWPAGLHAQGVGLEEESLRSIIEAYDELYNINPNLARTLSPLFMANLHNDLATRYSAQGRYAEAEPLYKRSLAIYEKALGPEHPNVATVLKNYAGLLRETGRTSEAAKMEVRATAIRAKRAGE